MADFFLFFSISIPFLNQSNQIEFKPGFESKHSEQMHRQESNTHATIYLIEKNQAKDFSYTIFPAKKNKIWAKF
jgi:hypothetical protein